MYYQATSYHKKARNDIRAATCHARHADIVVAGLLRGTQQVSRLKVKSDFEVKGDATKWLGVVVVRLFFIYR